MSLTLVEFRHPAEHLFSFDQIWTSQHINGVQEVAMAEYLASIFGTEKDKVNCSFYFKIGACRHGDRCSRIHNKPTFSQTLVIQNLYINPQNSAKSADGSHLTHVSDEEMQVSSK